MVTGVVVLCSLLDDFELLSLCHVEFDLSLQAMKITCLSKGQANLKVL